AGTSALSLHDALPIWDVDEADRAAVRECARRRFTGLTDQITYEKVCLYTNTPTEDFIVDRHPADPRIVFVAGLSGHGFKFILLRSEEHTSELQSLAYL